MSALIYTATACAAFLLLSFVAWRRYTLIAEQGCGDDDKCEYSLTEVFGADHLVNVPHQKGVRWLTEVFGRSAAKFPHLTALHIPHTGESLSFAELDARAEAIAAALSAFLTGPDQVAAIAVAQDDWRAVACHLGILKAGGTVVFLDDTLPDALLAHMLKDSDPVVVLTRGEANFHGLPTLDVLTVPVRSPRSDPPPWLDDPGQRLAAIFYTSGSTGMPKGVECPHAGYVNLALSYADYFDLIPGMDATSLTSSLGYDGSISEMYSAWVSGCAVVMLTKDEVRSGPDLIPILRRAEVTVLFCSPLLLTTLTTSPELDLPYPLCRFVVPAGEAFPSALVEPWTRARRQIINTYGPTEASTDTSRQSLRPGEPITIGSPLANVTYVILDPDQLRPLAHGEVGELCIGGVHVARGYRNLPELTARSFIIHPQFGRLYRTGDRCRIDMETQRVQFLGRIDAQLKVRGHRVEVQPVEDILQTQFAEIEAAVLDYQNETLVAFVVAPSICEGPISTLSPAPPEWAAQVTATLARQLPAPAVPTRMFLVETFAMKPLSGKIDRSRLPKLSDFGFKSPVVHGMPAGLTGAAVPPGRTPPAETALSSECREVLAICRAVIGTTSLGADDGFTQAGAHSILIARLAQQLQAVGWAVPVRALLSDCNTARKVAGRPRMCPQACNPSASPSSSVGHRRERGKEAEVLSIGRFTALQVLFVTLLYSPGLVVLLAALSLADIDTLFTAPALPDFLLVGFALYLLALAAPFGMLLWVMLMKLGLSGHIRKTGVVAGVYRKWSKVHLRLWCILRMQDAVLLMFAMMYRSAPLMAFMLRQLGAAVGENCQCAHDAHFSGPLDLIAIGNGVAVQTGAYVQSATWRGQDLHVAPVRLESGCKIGMRAAVADGVTVARGSWITPFTPILESVGPGEMWEGAPARRSGRCMALQRTAARRRYAWPIWVLETLNVAMQIALSFLLIVLPTAAISWLASGLIPAVDIPASAASLKLSAMPAIVRDTTLFAFVTTGLTLTVTSVLLCLFVRCTAAASPGLYASRGLAGALLMYRMQLMNIVQRVWTWTITGQYLRVLAGMRLPRAGGSECDLMFNLVPELATADSRVFWSNSCFTNMLDCGAEHLTLRQLDTPRNFFSGNNCVAEAGHFPSNFILGTSSPGSDIGFRRQMRSRLGQPAAVAGNPAVRFAGSSRERSDRAHEKPRFALFLARVFLFDLVSIGVLPIMEVLVFTIVFVSLLCVGLPLAGAALIALPLTEISVVLMSIATKKFLVGRRWGAQDSAPFWSWRHFGYFLAQDCFFVWCRSSLGFLAGTVLSNPILRRMGCRIGARTLVMQPMQCADWNAVSVGQDCVFDGVMQLHTFEDMVLKVKRADIEDGCVVSTGATVMGGAVLERNTAVLPLALVLKEMKLVSGIYEGSPAEPVAGPAGLSPAFPPAPAAQAHGRGKVHA